MFSHPCTMHQLGTDGDNSTLRYTLHVMDVIIGMWLGGAAIVAPVWQAPGTSWQNDVQLTGASQQMCLQLLAFMITLQSEW